MSSTDDASCTANKSRDIVLTAWRDHASFSGFVRLIQSSDFITNKSRVIVETMRIEGWRFVTAESKTVCDERTALSFLQRILETTSTNASRGAENDDARALSSTSKTDESVTSKASQSSEKSSRIDSADVETSPFNNDSPIKTRYPRRNSVLIPSMEKMVIDAVLANAMQSQDEDFQRLTSMTAAVGASVVAATTTTKKSPPRSPIQGILKPPTSNQSSARRVKWRKHNGKNDNTRRVSFNRETELVRPGPTLITLSGLSTKGVDHQGTKQFGRGADVVSCCDIPKVGLPQDTCQNSSHRTIQKEPMHVVSPIESTKHKVMISLGAEDRRVSSIFLDTTAPPLKFANTSVFLKPTSSRGIRGVSKKTSHHHYTTNEPESRVAVLKQPHATEGKSHGNFQGDEANEYTSRSVFGNVSADKQVTPTTDSNQQNLQEQEKGRRLENNEDSTMTQLRESATRVVMAAQKKEISWKLAPRDRPTAGDDESRAPKRLKSTSQRPEPAPSSTAASDQIAKPVSAYTASDVLLYRQYDIDVRNHPGNIAYYRYLLGLIDYFDRLHPNNESVVASAMTARFILNFSNVRFLVPTTVLANGGQKTTTWYHVPFDEAVKKTSKVLDEIRAGRRKITEKNKVDATSTAAAALDESP